MEPYVYLDLKGGSEVSNLELAIRDEGHGWCFRKPEHNEWRP